MDKDVDSSRITVVHPDILKTHILARLDGPTLAAVAATSSELSDLSADNTLWLNLCHRVWPSTAHPLLQHLITSFPSGHRSFYADSSSTLHCHNVSTANFVRCNAPWPPTLISAVDIHYKKGHVLSKVEETYTKPGLWTRSPFLVRLFNSGDSLPIPGSLDFLDPECESELENNLTLSWILIDPTRTRAANLTRLKPVSVNRDRSNWDVEVCFGTILSGHREGELVQCKVVVTCGGWENEDMNVKQVILELEDLEGNKLGWRESLALLQEAMESPERARRGRMEGYDKFSEMKTGRRERKRRRLEVVKISTHVILVISLWMFAVYTQVFRLLCSYF